MKLWLKGYLEPSQTYLWVSEDFPFYPHPIGFLKLKNFEGTVINENIGKPFHVHGSVVEDREVVIQTNAIIIPSKRAEIVRIEKGILYKW